MMAEMTGIEGSTLRPVGRQCNQLLLSGDQIFTPGHQPGPQDR